ncbi:MAG: hypothetical protein SGJ05_07835 [bacterium]|nr:hypothetical protein [bacterium]
MTESSPTIHAPAEFKVRIDFYWQAVALYALTLIAYIVVRALWESTLQQGIVTVVLTDPIVVLLGSFVIGSSLVLLFNWLARRSILVGANGITFASRFHERTFSSEEIERITIGRDRRIKVRGMFSVVKIKIANRRRPLRIRTALYNKEAGLIAAIAGLRKHHLRGS